MPRAAALTLETSVIVYDALFLALSEDTDTPGGWVDVRYADNRKPGWSSHGPYCSSPHETYLEDALASVMSGRPGTWRTRLWLDCAAGYSRHKVSAPAGPFSSPQPR